MYNTSRRESSEKSFVSCNRKFLLRFNFLKSNFINFSTEIPMETELNLSSAETNSISINLPASRKTCEKSLNTTNTDQQEPSRDEIWDEKSKFCNIIS